MKTLKSKEFIIGICAVIAIAIIIVGIDFLKGINMFKAANYYYATYSNVGGLAQSAPVTVNGFKVGQVREIEYEFDNPGHVKVELALDRKLRVPVGTKALLVTDMLGTSTIELHFSSSTDYHTVGESLIAENKAGLMDALGGDMLPKITALVPKIDSLISGLADLANDPALKNSVGSLEKVMANMETTAANLNRAMVSLPALTGQLNSTMKNIHTVSENAETITADLAEVSRQLSQARIDSTLSNINSITASLNDVMARLNTKDSTLGLLVNDPALYNSLNASVASLDSLLQDVKRNPKRYISIKLL